MHKSSRQMMTSSPKYGVERWGGRERGWIKSLVKLWDSSRSSYATVGLTHRQQKHARMWRIAEHETTSHMCSIKGTPTAITTSE